MQECYTHSVDELAQLEAESGLLFAGWLCDGRGLVSVLLRPERSREDRRQRILQLNAGNQNSDYW